VGCAQPLRRPRMLPGWSRIFGRSMRSTGSTFVVGGDQVADHKPAPDVYQLALTRLGVSCAEAVAVEDTGHGVDAAHAAGLACIAIPNPFVDASHVAHAELTLHSATECTLAQAGHSVSSADAAAEHRTSGWRQG